MPTGRVCAEQRVTWRVTTVPSGGHPGDCSIPSRDPPFAWRCCACSEPAVPTARATPQVIATVSQFLRDHGLEGKPLFFAGASSGGTIALKLPATLSAQNSRLRVDGIIAGGQCRNRQLWCRSSATYCLPHAQQAACELPANLHSPAELRIPTAAALSQPWRRGVHWWRHARRLWRR